MNLTENAAKSIICEVDKVNQTAQPRLTLHSKASGLMLEIADLKEEETSLVY